MRSQFLGLETTGSPLADGRLKTGQETSRRNLLLGRKQGLDELCGPRGQAALYFLAFASASSNFLMYLAGFLLKSLRQDLQHSLISRSL